MIWILLGLVTLYLVTRFYLDGENLSQFDDPVGEMFHSDREPGEEYDTVVASLAIGSGPIRKAPRRERLNMMRAYMDGISDGLDLPSTFTGVTVDGIPAEWVQAPNSVPGKRLLYIHGGAFVMGSPRSHRNITNRFAELTGASVLAIDYRLMPEHPRMAGVEDCRTAYRWILQHGPEGQREAEHIYIAGDSAGGNLTLSLLAWVRDAGLRPADAAVALSPATDSTMSSPSLKYNLETDAMLGPMFRGLARTPRSLLLWFGLLQSRRRPSDPALSPVYGDLSGLPPTLVHASETEMLLDDARRWVNRAVSQGSPARLQTWNHVVHVWHMFYPQLPAAGEAWDEIAKFIAAVEQGS